MKIKIDQFGGITPKLDPLDLPEYGAQIAENCYISNGKLVAWRSPLVLPAYNAASPQTTQPHDFPQSRKGLYQFSRRWLTWANPVCVEMSPLAGDTYDRIYWTSPGQKPKMAGAAELFGASENYPSASYDMGVPSPSIPPVVRIVEPPVPTLDLRIAMASTQVPMATVGVAYAYQLYAVGGTAPYTWSLPSGSSLPTGLSLSSSGVISGTVAAWNDLYLLGYNFSVKVTDAVSATNVKSFSIRVFTYSDPLYIATEKADMDLAKVGTPYNIKLVATGGTAPYTWSIGEGSLPAGLSLSSSGVISGTPTDIVNSPTFKVTDSTGAVATKAIAIVASILYDPTTVQYLSYVYTYVNQYGEEGMPSPPSTPIAVYPGQTIQLSGFVSYSGSHSFVEARRRYYRVASGSTSAVFQEITVSPDVTTGTFLDTTVDLGTALESTYYALPQADLQGLCSLPGGMMAGYSGKSVYISQPYHPHAWPYANRYSFTHNVTSLGAFGHSLFATTENGSFLITGSDPAAMTVEQSENSVSGVNQRTVVDAGDALIYASPLGLAKAGVGGFPVMTSPSIEARQWMEEYYPHSSLTHAVIYRDSLLYFWEHPTNGTRGGMHISAAGQITTIDPAQCWSCGSYHYPLSKDVFLLKRQVDGTALVAQWDHISGTPMVYRWKSKKFRAYYPVSMAAVQVKAKSYVNLSIKLYADGNLVHTSTVTSIEVFRIASGYTAQDWEVELIGVDTVEAVYVATCISDLASVQ